MNGFKTTKERSGSEAYEAYASKTDDYMVHVSKNYNRNNSNKIDFGSVTVYNGEEQLKRFEIGLDAYYTLKEAKAKAFGLIEKMRA